MNDPEAFDTEPITGAPPEAPDTDPRGLRDAVASDALVDDVERDVSEGDTDHFLRWLPTMALGHRRRRELVERPSSDGADFAAYACEGPPATAFAGPRPDAAVRVRLNPPRPSILPAAVANAPDRDALTVRMPRPSARRPSVRLACGAAGLIAASVIVTAWAARAPHASARGEPLAARPPVSEGLPYAAAAEPIPPQWPAESQGPPVAEAHRPKAGVGARAASSHPSSREAAPKKGLGRAHPPSNTPAENPAASATAAKDQYFEAP